MSISVRETYDAYVTELVGDVIDTADRVVVRQIWHGEGQGPESDLRVQMHPYSRCGRAGSSASSEFWDRAEALEAVGLRE